ncbi:dipicolinate synthase subunit DpsA [Mycolicibacterium goodii]|uniref:dipicolinate synthase subunit DpsA n=1 Tax=Mycolicibacterium goodii TaxID=134601 RepID=UPI001BDBBF22|nr:dipicolinate synthase subunit DpsA [Mycolicibacterium goodii]MBU8816576.1 hypothetical protein [Mycolicibacterium goodii]MBU8831689.1 hypothetical protein [Mycolicibacterium goodii]
MTVSVAVLGGDEREHHIASSLAETGCDVRTFGGVVVDPRASYRRARTARDAVSDAEWLLCPYPGLGVHDEIYAPASQVPIRLNRELLGASEAHRGGLVMGRAGQAVRDCCDDLGITIHETKADPGLAVQTATAVSEALISLLVESTDRVLREHLFLVMGFGATGFAITQLLLSMRCEVIVAARSKRDRARARQLGARPVAYRNRVGVMETADVVVNTVPSVDSVPLSVTTSRVTARIFDIASPPGGMDHQALVGAGLDVNWVRGLGGLRAPVSLAEALLEFVRDLVADTTENDQTPTPSTTATL